MMRLSGLFVPCLCLVFFSGFFIAGVSSCRHNDDITKLDPICFDSDILPIFQTSCARSGCHNGGDFDLSNFQGIRRGISPGDPMKSEFYKVMTNSWSVNMMPPDRPVSLENRTKIKVWIEQGAKPSCP